jgi:hypothetical protein
MMKVLLRPAFGGLLRRQFGAESLLSRYDGQPAQLTVPEKSVSHV